MAKAKLEKVLEYLINKDEDAARELLHQFIVEQAKSIHEELMEEDNPFEDHSEGDEPVDENDSEDPVAELEEYFDEDDLQEAEDDDPVADLSDDMAVDFDDEEEDAADLDDVDATLDDGEEVDLEAALQELQDEFERLQSEVQDLKDEGDTDELEDVGADAEIEDDEPVLPEGDEPEDVTEDDADFFEELDGLLGEDFDDLSEGIVDELEPVKMDPYKAQFVGADQSNWKKASTASGVNPKPFGQRSTTSPYEIKSSTYVGYDRENPPKVAQPEKPAKNALKKAGERQNKAADQVNNNSILGGGRHKNDPAGYSTKPESMEGGSLLARTKKSAKVNVKESVKKTPAPKSKKSR